MRHLLLTVLFLCSSFISAGYASAVPGIVLGVDQEHIYGPLLKNQRVGLMVNQSSINKQGRHTIDKLLAEQENINLP